MHSQISPADAATELLRRRSIRRSFLEWCQYKGFEPAAHHCLIIEAIEEFLDSDDEVLLLFAPPGSAKSTYVSVLFPAWYLANNPDKAILAATHSVEFAERWGRRVRNDIALDGNILGIALDERNQAAARWALQEGGEYYGVGAGVGISGFRADLGIGDDFFGSREDAWSQTVRRKRWDWYIDDFSARLKPGAKRILMNTRWHEEDVAGMVLGQIERGEIKGRVISIPAKAELDDPLGREPGDYLWDDPKGYNYGAFLRARERESTPLMWAALYQQRPTPEQGEYFKREWIIDCVRKEVPLKERMRFYGGSDYAVTADGGDYTTHGIIGMDEKENWYLVDLWRGQTASDVWAEQQGEMILRWKPLAWAEETGQIRSGIGPFRDRVLRDMRAHVAFEAFPTRYDKAVRAQSARGRMAMNGLYVPHDLAFREEFVSELMRFPAGAHDDFVDMIGLIGQLVDRMLAGRKPEPVRHYPQRAPVAGGWMG